MNPRALANTGNEFEERLQADKPYQAPINCRGANTLHHHPLLNLET